MGDSLFKYCFELTSVHIPDTVCVIENEAFDSCYNLKSVMLPSKVELQGNPFSSETSVKILETNRPFHDLLYGIELSE